jgi:hypothetical protein
MWPDELGGSLDTITMLFPLRLLYRPELANSQDARLSETARVSRTLIIILRLRDGLKSSSGYLFSIIEERAYHQPLFL